MQQQQQQQQQHIYEPIPAMANPHFNMGKEYEASFLKEYSRLRSKLAPTQRWHSAQLAPMRELAPMLVFKKLASSLYATVEK
jgi:hypothetical protein